MKKLFALATAALLFSGMAGAQTYFNAGYGKPTDVVTFGDTEAETTTFNTAFAGLSHNITMGKAFGIEAGVNFVYGFNNDINEIAGLETNLKYTSYGLNAPILLNYGIPVGNLLTLKVLAGPTLHYGISSQIASIVDGKEMYTVDYYDENNYERFFVSAGAAVAAEFSNKLRLKVGYDLGLTDIDKAEKISLRENLVSCTLSFIF
ncbi:MAG: PorT family protein [Bacteroidales bacterium]|nr:PorT family protein [Bacteroidales bacterium]